jgi:ABC-type Fe3+/spermidine/putrescine transport system ATPase subunit
VAERITIEHLSKTYPGGNQALSDVSLSVGAGTFLVLLGPSGSG